MRKRDKEKILRRLELEDQARTASEHIKVYTEELEMDERKKALIGRIATHRELLNNIIAEAAEMGLYVDENGRILKESRVVLALAEPILNLSYISRLLTGNPTGLNRQRKIPKRFRADVNELKAFHRTWIKRMQQRGGLIYSVETVNGETRLVL